MILYKKGSAPGDGIALESNQITNTEPLAGLLAFGPAVVKEIIDHAPTIRTETYSPRGR